MTLRKYHTNAKSRLDLGCQFAHAQGLQVIGIDARDKGLDLARKSGADVVIDARIGKEKVAEEVKKVTDQKGVDSALTLSDAPGAAALACAITKVSQSEDDIVRCTALMKMIDAWHHDTDCSGGLIFFPLHLNDLAACWFILTTF